MRSGEDLEAGTRRPQKTAAYPALGGRPTPWGPQQWGGPWVAGGSGGTFSRAPPPAPPGSPASLPPVPRPANTNTVGLDITHSMVQLRSPHAAVGHPDRLRRAGNAKSHGSCGVAGAVTQGPPRGGGGQVTASATRAVGSLWASRDRCVSDKCDRKGEGADMVCDSPIAPSCRVCYHAPQLDGREASPSSIGTHP